MNKRILELEYRTGRISRGRFKRIASEIRKHNYIEYIKKQRLEVCGGGSCEFIGQPHEHVYEAKYLDFRGRKIKDPGFPYHLRDG